MRPLLFASLLFAAAPAFALECGDVVLHDTVLTADLTCHGEDNALLVGRSGVTLDLGGYTIRGADVGVAVEDAHGVRVSNGRIEDVRVGVLVLRGENARIDHIDFIALGDGVRLHNAERAHVVANRFDGVVGHAVAVLALPWALTGGGRHEIRDNLVADSEYGVLLSGWDSGGTVIASNTFERVGSIGVVLDRNSAGNRIEHNQFGETGVATIAH